MDTGSMYQDWDVGGGVDVVFRNLRRLELEEDVGRPVEAERETGMDGDTHALLTREGD